MRAGQAGSAPVKTRSDLGKTKSDLEKIRSDLVSLQSDLAGTTLRAVPAGTLPERSPPGGTTPPRPRKTCAPRRYRRPDRAGRTVR